VCCFKVANMSIRFSMYVDAAGHVGREGELPH
jgi:hypothetical protein